MVAGMFTAFKALCSMVSVNIQFAGQTLSMAALELRKRYSGSTIGVLWAVVRPAVFISVYWFGIQLGIRGNRPMDEAPFILWLLAGILPWFFVADVLSSCGHALVSNRHLITKAVFPVSTIPTFTVLHLFFVHLALTAVTVAVFAFSDFGVGIYLLQLPYYMLCLFAMMWAVSVFFSACSAVSRDFEHMLKSAIQVFFWITPILWKADMIPAGLRFVIKLNPVAYIVDGYRNVFIYERWFFENLKWTAYFWAFLLVFLLTGAHLFKRLEKEFADIL